ncbi:hypothetical protein [Streptomyces sp. NPDC088739]|uniref:hypothetical protein n=1 Tax=Streptomyces sp. NPDC088739 TaxID=3365882 RepID=UPI003818CAF3
MSDEQPQEGPESAEKPKRGRRLSDYSAASNVPPVVPLVDADQYLAKTSGDEGPAPEPERPATGRLPYTPPYAAIERRYQAPAPSTRQLPWDEQPGPYYGAPRPYPAPADVLDRRKVARKPLHLSVPEDLNLAKRLDAFRFYCQVDVPGDVVAVALDEYLSARGY